MTKRILTWATFVLFTAAAMSCSKRATAPSTQSTPELEARGQKIKQIEESASDGALARKLRSDALLNGEGVPVNKNLPVIQDEPDSTRRTTDQVATRAMALCVVAIKGEGVEQAKINQLIEKHNLSSAFTPKEKAFLDNPQPSEQERTQFVWRYECYWVMLWSLGFVDKLDRPEDTCDVPKAIAMFLDNGREAFLKQAKLRPQREILDAADLIYRYHWATTDARINGRPSPAKLSDDVVVERHYALNWLIGYMGQEWDDISTDT